jgi:hypothetical protein
METTMEMSDELPMSLNEEDHVVRMVLRSSERMLKFLGKEFVPDQILDNERVLLSKAAALWIALHPMETSEESVTGYWTALGIVRERLRSPMYTMSQEEFDKMMERTDDDIDSLPPDCSPEEAARILSRPMRVESVREQMEQASENQIKPNLTLHKGGKSHGQK